MADEGPSLPSNYVTILHLKERWLKQQQSSAKSSPNHHESNSNLTVKPKHDSDSASASKIPNESVHPRTNPPPIVIQLKPNVTPHDSDFKTPNESVHRRRNHHQAINQTKPEATVHDSASKTVVKGVDNHQTEEKQKRNTDQSKPNPHESDSKLSVKPKHDSASSSKIANESVHPRTNRHRIANHFKPDVTPHDSASKTPNESVHRRTNRHQVINQPKLEVTVHDSASKAVIQVADNHQTVEKQKQEQNTDESNPKPSKTKKKSKRRNPRFVTDQIPTGGSTTPSEPVPEPVPEKKQHHQKGGRRNLNQEVRKPKSEPVAGKLNDSSRNDSGGDGGCFVEAAAAVKEINITNVSQRTDRGWSSGGFHGGRRTGPVKPPFGVKKEQAMTAVWVRKGESASN